MRRLSLQKGCLIFVYFMIVLGFFWLSMNEVRTMTDTISVDDYVQNDDSSNIPEGSYRQDEDNLKETNIYEELQNYKIYYENEFTKQFIPVIINFSIVFSISSIFFWILMHKLQKKERLLIANDITSLKQYEKLPDADPILKQAYQTIQKSYEQHFEDYKRLHSYLSHEQKNALALLQNNLQLHEYDRCQRNIDSLHQGIEDLLTISDSLEPETLYPVDVIEVCARVCDDYSRQAEIIFDFDEEECFIQAKERWIYRSVANLVDNAIKYGEGHPIEVSVHHIDNQVKISVKDKGIGIDPKQQEHIFKHHMRINKLNKDGYGIGLSLVQHVIELSQGSIDVKSERHQGTTITLIFPCL